MNLFWCKANVKRFGLNNLHQDFDIMGIVHTASNRCFFLFFFFFAPVILTSIHCCVNNSRYIQVLMKVIRTKTFDVGFISKWIHLIWEILFFYFLHAVEVRSIFTSIYIYIFAIKICRKVDKPILTTDSAMIFHFLLKKNFIRIKNKISKLLNPLSVFVYPLFCLFFLSCQIYHNLPFLDIHIYIYIYCHPQTVSLYHNTSVWLDM